VIRPESVLCDTHLLLWALSDPARLPRDARACLERAEVFVSAASVWEISIKASMGRIDCDPAQVADAIEAVGFRHLPVTAAHAARVFTLPAIHRDPFDRMLVAQALSESIPLLTSDGALAAYGDVVRMV
jgi:PIN domain nuclease of toxin-antitoxin system